jgi:hypothetical protein
MNETWEEIVPYPLPIGESMGGIVDGKLFVVSGFTKGWSTLTDKVYGLNTKGDITKAKWKEYDPVPIPAFSHSAFVVTPNRSMLFTCGGYGKSHIWHAFKMALRKNFA